MLLRLAVLLCLLLPWAAQALQSVPPLAARVTDLTATLSAAERGALEARLADVERRHGSQLAVLIVPTTQPETIEQYGIRVVDAWRLGRQGIDDGLLVLVAKDDRTLRLEVGRGLEGAIPDAIAKRIIAERITPAFRAGRFAEGLNAGVDAIVARIEGEALPPPRESRRDDAVDVADMLFTTVFVAFFAAPVLRAMFGRLFGAAAGGMAGGAWWFMQSGALALAGLGALVAALAVLLIGSGRGGGPWITGRGHGGGWSSGGGGFSGGGGGFSGGGASGRW